MKVDVTVPVVRQRPPEDTPQFGVENVHRPFECVEKLRSAALLGHPG